MKRKRQPGKLTTSELIEAGHFDLARELRTRLAESITRRRPKFTPVRGRGFITIDTTTP